MQTIILNFTNSILPIAVVVFVGFLLRRWRPLDPKQVAYVAFNIMGPALIFREVYSSDIPFQESFKMLGITIALLVLLLAIGWTMGRLFNVSRSERSALILTVMFMNCGNFGLSAVEFSFGGEALAWGSLFFTTEVVINVVGGVYIAESGNMSVGRTIQQIFKVPVIYAIGAAFFARATQIDIPAVIMRPIDLAASGAIPLFLVLLGIQIAEAGMPRNWRLVSLATGIRLILSPLIAIGLAILFNLQGLPFKVLVLQAGMPIAVLNGVIATEYDLEPDLVASTILFSTLLSPITLSLLLSMINVI